MIKDNLIVVLIENLLFRNADILGFDRSHKDNKEEVENFIKSKSSKEERNIKFQ